MNIDEIHRLVEEETQESLYLEFKQGSALSKQDKPKSELVKDVTAFANGAGGKIIYGIAEKKNNTTGIYHASGISPVTSEDITKDWVSLVIKDNSAPRFHLFNIDEIPTEGGRIIVIDVLQAGTAHQNLLDHRYYQRAGVTNSPLQDFQIRDLMARGIRPEAEVRVSFPPEFQGNDRHRYAIKVEIENTGSVTFENWWFTLNIPSFLLDGKTQSEFDSMRFHPLYHVMARQGVTIGRHNYTTISMGDPFYTGRRLILHPSQSQELWNKAFDMPPFRIEVNDDAYQKLRGHPPITWKLFLRNAQPLEGSIPMENWCKY